MEEKEIRSVKLYKALANPTRYKILKLLLKQKMSVNEIAKSTNKTMQSISQHLRILKNIDIVKYHMEGKYIFYEIKRKGLVEDIYEIEKNFLRLNK